MEPEICTKMLKKMSGKLGAKFPATTPHYSSMVKIDRLNDAFLEVYLTGSRRGRRSITAAKRTEKEKKEREKQFQKSKKPKDVGHLLMQKLSKF